MGVGASEEPVGRHGFSAGAEVETWTLIAGNRRLGCLPAACPRSSTQISSQQSTEGTSQLPSLSRDLHVIFQPGTGVLDDVLWNSTIGISLSGPRGPSISSCHSRRCVRQNDANGNQAACRLDQGLDSRKASFPHPAQAECPRDRSECLELRRSCHLAGQGAPAACHAFTFAENSSCGVGTGVRPSPGFHPHITSLSSVRCSTN